MTEQAGLAAQAMDERKASFVRTLSARSRKPFSCWSSWPSPRGDARQLAELLGEPRTTVYRLLGSLEALDLVEPGAQPGTYRLGWKLMRLGAAVIERLDERQAALPVMERIHEATGETVFLLVRRGDDAVCIERLEGLRVQSLALRLGGSLPLHVGAGPRALLAWESRESGATYAAAQGSSPARRASGRIPGRALRGAHPTRDQGYANRSAKFRRCFFRLELAGRAR